MMMLSHSLLMRGRGMDLNKVGNAISLGGVHVARSTGAES
jgi:hypothetical protein